FAAPANWVQKKGAKRRCFSSANWLGWAAAAGWSAPSVAAMSCMTSSSLLFSSRLHGRPDAILRLPLRRQRGDHRPGRAGCHDVLEGVAGQQLAAGLQDG